MRTSAAFTLLGLDPDTASVLDVETAWRAQRSATHPDKPGGSATTFHQMKTAYDMARRHVMLPKPCADCGGSGKRSIPGKASFGGSLLMTCKTCRGSGQRRMP